MSSSGGFYSNFLLFTIGAVCLLILVGGVVRSTGSGMGCPNWPKCFGNWVPPSDISELPDDYKGIYSQKRYQKNIRLSNYFGFFGFEELAGKLRNDQSILEEEVFNPTKTWIEYLNRLLGVAIGFLIMLNVVFSYGRRKANPKFIKLAVLNLFLVGFQGWVGSIVVSTNLLEGLITFHMILALLILAVLIYNYWLIGSNIHHLIQNDKAGGMANKLIIISLILISIQIVLGTQVRESIDIIATGLGEAARADWIEQLGLTFYIHRSYSIIVFGVHLYCCLLVVKLFKRSHLVYLIYGLLALLVFEIISGVAMAYFGIPPIFQPIHLLFGTLIFGVDFYLLLILGELTKMKIKRPELNHNVE